MKPLPGRRILTPCLQKTISLRGLEHTEGHAVSRGDGDLDAGSSGLGTIKESFAIAQGIAQNQASDSPFIRDLTSRTEMEAAQTSLRAAFGESKEGPSVDSLQRLALEKVRASLAVLSGKAGADETDAYRRLLYGLAEKVANAASEGGILGFGGTQVSKGEQTFLDDLRTTFKWNASRRRNGRVPSRFNVGLVTLTNSLADLVRAGPLYHSTLKERIANAQQQ